VVVVGVAAIVLSLVIGVVAFFAIAAAVLVLAAVIGVRIWWLSLKARKRMGQQRGGAQTGPAKTTDRSVIEGEYRVVAADRKDDKPPQP